MKLISIRRPSLNNCTFGDLTEETSGFHCFTLERPEVQIPTGTYPIEITYSPRFSRPLPLLLNVPQREAIRIHSGNWPRDTEGCLLVGLQLGDNMLVQSRAALDPLVTLIQQAVERGEPVTLTIS